MGDYFQNIGMPHLGGDQPVNIYNFSPLIINVFGFIEYSTELLEACIYTESKGKQVDNSVASLVHECFDEKVVFDYAKNIVPV